MASMPPRKRLVLTESRTVPSILLSQKRDDSALDDNEKTHKPSTRHGTKSNADSKEVAATSKRTIDMLLDCIWVEAILGFLGPHYALVFGYTCKKYHKLSLSDALWRQFSAMWGCSTLAMELALHKISKGRHDDGSDILLARAAQFRRIADNKEAGALQRYKRLLKSPWPVKQRSNNELVCDVCYDQAATVTCMVKGCLRARCNAHKGNCDISAVRLVHCDWCGVTMCYQHALEENLFDICVGCNTHLCLDCQPISNLGPTKQCSQRDCWEKSCYKCSFYFRDNNDGGGCPGIDDVGKFETASAFRGAEEVYCSRYCLYPREQS